MKKILSLVLALALVMSLSVTAFAAETATSTGGDSTITVKGTYNGTASSETVSVDIAWDAMSFTYNAASQGTWVPGDHSYSGAAAESWSATGNTITVTNHSNVAVTASFAFAKDSAVTTELTGSFTYGDKTATENAVTLAAGVVNGYDSADKVVATLAMNGSLPADWTAGNTIGTVTVTIAKAN